MWKALVVDDIPLNCKLICAMLKNLAECDTALNGEEAINLYLEAARKTTAYDIILLDIEMPVIDGMSVLYYIREKEKMPERWNIKRVPIIMITGRVEYSEKVFSMGCDDFMKKPVQKDILLKKIRTAIYTY